MVVFEVAMLTKAKEKIDYENSPVAWFVVLEQARQGNDFERAAKARQELKRLGVDVKYPIRTHLATTKETVNVG